MIWKLYDSLIVGDATWIDDIVIEKNLKFNRWVKLVKIGLALKPYWSKLTRVYFNLSIIEIIVCLIIGKIIDHLWNWEFISLEWN